MLIQLFLPPRLNDFLCPLVQWLDIDGVCFWSSLEGLFGRGFLLLGLLVRARRVGMDAGGGDWRGAWVGLRMDMSLRGRIVRGLGLLVGVQCFEDVFDYLSDSLMLPHCNH
jgi:hypothetical protein